MEHRVYAQVAPFLYLGLQGVLPVPLLPIQRLGLLFAKYVHVGPTPISQMSVPVNSALLALSPLAMPLSAPHAPVVPIHLAQVQLVAGHVLGAGIASTG